MKVVDMRAQEGQSSKVRGGKTEVQVLGRENQFISWQSESFSFNPAHTHGGVKHPQMVEGLLASTNYSLGRSIEVSVQPRIGIAGHPATGRVTLCETGVSMYS